MPDTLTAEQRSAAMRAVRRRDTKPERALRLALREVGMVGYRCDVGDLPGRPDIVFRRCRIAIFVDGGLWHGHPERYWPGRSSPYWDAKIARNIERDIINTRRLREVGWTVLRFWDSEILKDRDRVVQAVVAAITDSVGKAKTGTALTQRQLSRRPGRYHSQA